MGFDDSSSGRGSLGNGEFVAADTLEADDRAWLIAVSSSQPVLLPGMSKLKSQTCRCLELPEVINWASKPDGFESSLFELSAGNWWKLFRCSVCKQLWRIDEWDKYQTQFAAKVPDIESWETYDASSFQKRLLLQSRGGLSINLCHRAHCGKPAVKGDAFCVDHLYETGARK